MNAYRAKKSRGGQTQILRGQPHIKGGENQFPREGRGEGAKAPLQHSPKINLCTNMYFPFINNNNIIAADYAVCYSALIRCFVSHLCMLSLNNKKN